MRERNSLLLVNGLTSSVNTDRVLPRQVHSIRGISRHRERFLLGHICCRTVPVAIPCVIAAFSRAFSRRGSIRGINRCQLEMLGSPPTLAPILSHRRPSQTRVFYSNSFFFRNCCLESTVRWPYSTGPVLAFGIKYMVTSFAGFERQCKYQNPLCVIKPSRLALWDSYRPHEQPRPMGGV